MRYILALLTASIFSFNVSADQIRLATEGAFPPFNLIDENGNVAGLERDLGDALCKRANLECTWVTNDWNSILPNLLSGNFDAILAGMSVSDERLAVIDFSDTYFPPEPSSFASGNLESCLGENISVAVQAGSLQATYVAETGGFVVEFATAAETISSVENGETDCVLAPKKMLGEHFELQNSNLEFVDEDLYLGAGVAIGLRKSDVLLKSQFNRALLDMKVDGSLNKIIGKYFNGFAPF